MKRTSVIVVIAIAMAGLLLSGCVSRSENRPPTAVFSTSSSAINVGQQVIFDGQNATDRDGKIVRYHWDFGDSTEDLGVSVVHVFGAGGNYTVTLTVTDNDGKKDRANATVRVNEYPKARIDCSAREAKVLAPVSFSAQNSTDPDGRIVSCLWDFGDGVNMTGMQVSHAFQDTGTYSVNLTVTDDFCAPNRNSMDVTVVMRSFSISWSIVPSSVPQQSDHSGENTTVNKTVALPYDNMTLAAFRLSWKDDIPHWVLGAYNDDFSLKVVDPGNNTQMLRDMAGNITLNFSLAEPPAPIFLNARTEVEARAQVGGKYSKDVGAGSWNVSVILGEAKGAQQITGTDLDTGNNWKLDVTYYRYEMVVTEK